MVSFIYVYSRKEQLKVKYSIIRDSREKPNQGWVFQPDERIISTQIKALKEGDYTIEGLENKVIIERKGGLSEFAKNVIEDRFERELERLKVYPFSFLLLEFSMEDLIDYPKSLKLPSYMKNKISLTGRFLLKRVIEIDMKYPTKILFVGSKGYDVAYSIFYNTWLFYA